ncbi:asparaginyl/glutamyl-tRNA amidotransferase subunit C [Niabella ginsenosidivorans]|uniref:Aspartyl/glutamyl-tRNA(Asn/Gln) amidotransferase subunit C n=1 Tax=Niabella ginsenosidivorans TaxID=1176587 RepID=A0A1A9I3X6_9BACT|nr:Asp-tRNA(Asn)/Glu-tRNA(Gln) amidotransferase subunit GatC [Niabella ginsenosidivorans]ANH82243.1 asparaginyl/glutamyl-tRNA amidotransferase subunit C [Niabella ginsenosidivorans]
MEVNEALIDKLAHLSKLTFSSEEKQEFMGDLEKMIGFVEKLNELDLNDVEPLMHMSNEINVLRKDIVQGSISRDEALLNAPATDGVFFKVPKVIRK